MVSDNDSKPSVITGGFVVFNICWNHFSTEVDSLNFRKSLSGIFLPFTTPKTGESPPTNGGRLGSKYCIYKYLQNP